MGNFIVEIVAVGGHGCDRTTKEGQAINFDHASPELVDKLNKLMRSVDPDCFFRALVLALKKGSGMSLDEHTAKTTLGKLSAATLMHWPQMERIVDDLDSGVRLQSDFSGFAGARAAYERYLHSSGGKSLVSGAELPGFDALSPEIKAAWKAAADPTAQRLVR